MNHIRPDIPISSYCILIADDDSDDLFFFTDALKKAGVLFSILTFSDGDLLIDHVQKKKHDKENFNPLLIVCDLNMPKKNGKDVLKVIKNDPDLNEIPFIILSTSNNPKDIEECYRLGVSSYLTKPAYVDDMEIIANGIKAIWLDNHPDNAC